MDPIRSRTVKSFTELTWEEKDGGFFTESENVIAKEIEGRIVYTGPAIEALANYEANSKKVEEVLEILDSCCESQEGSETWIGAFQVKDAEKLIIQIAKIFGYEI